MFSFTARFNLRFSKTAGCWSINQDKYNYKAEYLFTSAGTWGRPHRRRQPGSQGLVASDEPFGAPRPRQPLVQGPRLLRGRSQRRSPERWERVQDEWLRREYCMDTQVQKGWPVHIKPLTSEYIGRCQCLRWIVPSSDQHQVPNQSCLKTVLFQCIFEEKVWTGLISLPSWPPIARCSFVSSWKFSS